MSKNKLPRRIKQPTNAKLCWCHCATAVVKVDRTAANRWWLHVELEASPKPAVVAAAAAAPSRMTGVCLVDRHSLAKLESTSNATTKTATAAKTAPATVAVTVTTGRRISVALGDYWLAKADQRLGPEWQQRCSRWTR